MKKIESVNQNIIIMGNKMRYLVIILALIACNSDSDYICEPNCDEPQIPEICLEDEGITSTLSGFTMLAKGEQIEGFAKGIKINETWEASAFIRTISNGSEPHILMQTYWDEPFAPPPLIIGEILSFQNIPVVDTIICLLLTNDLMETDKLYCRYKINNADQNLVEYLLDDSAINKIEIEKFDPDAVIFKAKFSASFISEEPLLPWFTKEVRLFNVYISIGG